MPGMIVQDHLTNMFGQKRVKLTDPEEIKAYHAGYDDEPDKKELGKSRRISPKGS